MLNFVICDDRQSTIDKLNDMLEKIFCAKNLDAQVSYSCQNPFDVINYIENNPVNVLILDIDLKASLNGIDLANKIRKLDKSVYIIFITGHSEYVFLSFHSKTFDYIQKPITLSRLSDTIDRLYEDIEGSPKTFINIDNRNKTFIDRNQITYIKKDSMKLVYYTINNKYETYSSFSRIEHNLPANFIRCHKSYIINMDNVVGIQDDNIIQFKNNTSCEIGPKYKKNIIEAIRNYENLKSNNY